MTMKWKAICTALLILYLLWNWLPLLVFLLGVLYIYLSRNNRYWHSRGVPFLKPAPFIGNLSPMLYLRESPGQFIGGLYEKGVGKSYIGYFIFDKPALVIRDLGLIKNILVKDFEHFHSRFANTFPNVDPVGARNLFVTRGQRWKFFRVHLSPIFTTAKLRTYLQQMCWYSEELAAYLGEVSADKGQPMTIRDVIARSATDVVTSCMMGIRSNTLRDKNADFRKYGKKIFGFSTSRAFEILGHFFYPGFVRIAKFNFFSKDATAFFHKVIGEIVAFRKLHHVERNDLLDTLLKLREGNDDRNFNHQRTSSPKLDVSDEDVIGQSAIFFGAGFETTSIAVSFTLYEMAVNRSIQSRLREDIQCILEEHNGKISYEAISQMKYLDMVVSETLRKYPPLLHLDRVCHKDYKLPDSEVTIEKGTPVFIPVFAIHRDPQYYPDPLKYDPERFTEENKQSRPQFAYMPFGQGPHNCIGMRFGLLTTKVFLVTVLSRFEVLPSEETPCPVQLSPFALFLSSVGGIPLLFKHLDKQTVVA